VYEGEWLEYVLCWLGILNFCFGDVYEGGFLDDLKHGEGRLMSSASGEVSVYEGSFERDIRHGTGVYSGVY
jgi:hypothetical protein